MQKNNYAFIDSQNVHLGIRELGWKLDFAKLHTYLEEKYSVSRAYLFIGYVPWNGSLYTALQTIGYICVFKPALIHTGSVIKGNCDAELVLQAMIDYQNYDGAVIVTGDGDFHCLAKHLLESRKLEIMLIPNQNKFSGLLKMKCFRPYLRYMNNLREKLSY